MPNTTTTVSPPSVPPSLSGFTLKSSRDTLSPSSMLAWLIWAPSGYGKTRLAGQLDALTQKHLGKRTLMIPLEAAEGGGCASIRSLDLPTFEPKDYSELVKFLAYLRNDKSIGGIVLDSATEMVKIFVKDAALKYACRENVETRKAGVPCRSDYQVMGELTSQVLRSLMLLPRHPDPAYRKHLIVTAADTSKEEDEKIVWVGPDLAGRMRLEAVQMFQQVGTLKIKPRVVEGKRVSTRVLTFSGDGVLAVKDRYDIFPAEMEVQKEPGASGESITSIYEKYWLPNVVQPAAA